MTPGWFAVQRDVFNHPAFAGDVGKTGAWLDIVGMAAFEPVCRETACGRVDLERGQVLLSVRFLRQRWGWSHGAVQRFLKDLVDRKMLGTPSGTPTGTPTGTVYTVVNYNTYQSPADKVGTGSGTRSGTKITKKQDNKKRKTTADPADKAAADSINRDAQELVKRIVEVGLRGHTPPNYVRQIGRAKQLLKDKPLAYWFEAADAMGRLFPHNRNPWDVFNLGTDGGRAVAMVREAKPAAPAARADRLRGALAAVRRQQPDFAGGLPDPNRTGVRIDPADYAGWNLVLEAAGLLTIEQARVAA